MNSLINKFIIHYTILLLLVVIRLTDKTILIHEPFSSLVSFPFFKTMKNFRQEFGESELNSTKMGKHLELLCRDSPVTIQLDLKLLSRRSFQVGWNETLPKTFNSYVSFPLKLARTCGDRVWSGHGGRRIQELDAILDSFSSMRFNWLC